MSRLIDLTGQTFGRLTVLKMAEKRGRNVTWECQCNCGKTKIIIGQSLRRGTTKSCGCLEIENRRDLIIKQTKHNSTKTPEFSTWSAMIERCEYIKNNRYKLYGGRGISVCPEWRHSFSQFLKDMGPRPFPKAQIDRIDNNGNYEPGNCRWTDRVTQANNTRFNHRLNVDGKSKTIAEWSRFTGISHLTIRSRLVYGWSEKDAVTIPANSVSKYENTFRI